MKKIFKAGDFILELFTDVHPVTMHLTKTYSKHSSIQVRINHTELRALEYLIKEAINATQNHLDQTNQKERI